jgi:hypothetical protein
MIFNFGAQSQTLMSRYCKDANQKSLELLMPRDTSQMIHSIVILRYQPLKKLSRNSTKDIASI